MSRVRDLRQPAPADWLSIAASTLHGSEPASRLDSTSMEGERCLGSAFPINRAERTGPSRRHQEPHGLPLEFLAHVETDLPGPTVFGATPEGLRMSFYVSRGSWKGPNFQARYKPEGGDWLLVREDGVALPNVRATLETSDGALLYYQATGKLDLGPEGYRQCQENRLPDAAPFAIGAGLSTADERWKWLNRRMLLGVGIVNLKTAHVSYDVYSLGGNLTSPSLR